MSAPFYQKPMRQGAQLAVVADMCNAKYAGPFLGEFVMINKILLGGAGAALLMGLVFGRDAISYVSTSASQLHAQVKDSVPVEFEIERARKMIKDLTPEIRRNMHLIAKEEVEVEKLQARVGNLKEELAKSKQEVLRLKDDLGEGKTYYTYASHRYSRDEVQTDLAVRFERYKTQEATREKLDGILRAREQGLQAARGKLDAMLAARRQLEVDVENLEARQKMIEVAQSSSNFSFDESHLSRTRRLVEEIQTRLEVAERMVDSEGSLRGEIRLEEPQHSDVLDQVTSYFDDKDDDKVQEGGRDRKESLTSRIQLDPSLN